MKSVFLAVGSMILTICFYLFWWQSPLLSQLDYKSYDLLTHTFPSYHTPGSTVVVEIDDKSLKAFGQWPWPRMITAELVNSIADANPSAVALDIVFSEKDRSSPVTLRTFYRDFFDINISLEGLPKELDDNDRILSEAITRTKTVLPVFSDISVQGKECVLPSTVIQKDEIPTEQFQNIGNVVCSLPMYQQRAKGIGHIHAVADSDGTLRRLSLLMRHNNTLIPTLGIAAVTSIEPTIRIYPLSALMGDMELTVAGSRFALDQHSNALLEFYPFEQYERVSAYDLLTHTYDPKRLQGKFVFVGATAFGLDTWHTISDGSVRPGVFTHATVVENLINGDLKVQPSFYRPLNIVSSFVIALVMLILMIRKRYLSVLFFSIMVVSVAMLITYLAWQQHIYLSLGYLIIPLLSYLFILSLLMFVIDYRDKKRFIDEIQRTSEQKSRLKSALDRSENEIEYQKAMLFQQSKLAAMGEMIDNIAHQWRQPLNMLSVIVQDTQYAYGSGKVDKNYIDTMTSESMEQIVFMSQTIEDFRNFIKPDQKNASFDLNQPVAESLELLAGMFESQRIIIDVQYCDNPLDIFGSASEFKQVMINLLHNARDALIENQSPNPTITLRVFGDDTYGAITLQDNGGGIHPDVIERIFEPYFTTKEEGKGSGIGLYMSYAIIRTKMGGSIGVENVDNGTMFTLTLPLWRDFEEKDSKKF
ncbi:CHASE2 and HATPase_c domain-containing protein [Sulfuricurvum sp.]|uniref:CHASE2 and HATPase_c domain-containing protein n=1 Tax=Sulfuricurvum sp. TaxID=2025608 RepID=UPI0026039C62|nr:CHASE2 and HATPase_c domain-containing protein [Sulfuricurvum sp.]